MATANEDIRDGITRHQVRVFRFARSLEGELADIFIATNPRLRDRIEALLSRFPASRFQARSSNRLLRDFDRKVARLFKPSERQSLELVRQRLVELANREAQFASSLIAASLPVVATLPTPTKRELRNLVRTVPHDGLPLTGWVTQLWRGDRERITAQISIGIAADESRRQILRRVFGRRSLRGRDGVREISMRNVATLSRTLSNSVAHLARSQTYQASEVVTEELFVATLDRRTSAICRATDGARFPVGEGLTPPLHRNCRSLRVPFVDGERLGTRPANAATERALRGLRGRERRAAVSQLVGQVPETQTYATFLRNQPVSFQNEALGVTKAKLFRKGGLELDQFVDPTGRELTLDELYELERPAFERAGVPQP